MASTKHAPAPTPEGIEEVLVRVLARLLGRSEDDIRSDGGRYAAFHNDDSGYDLEPGWIDWASLTFADEEGEDDESDEAEDDEAEDDEDNADDEDPGNDNLYGRRDFDLARSIFACEFEKKRGDAALQALLDSQADELYGTQIQALVADGRLDPEELAELSIFGRIRATSDSLLDAARALCLLDRFGEAPPLRPGPYSKVSRKWGAFLKVASRSTELRDHLGLFFQTANAARCSGAAYDEASGESEEAETLLEIAGQPSFTILAAWDVGEGQGRFFLARIDNDAISSVPPRVAKEPKRRTSRKP